ncbi:MAG: insulinase family protein [Clostridia bacterium]|nr:insulinase family protein [Clostridia bacterium]
MKPVKLTLRGGGTLLTLTTDKFKTELMTITLPLLHSQRTARLCRILFDTIKRGCRAYPDIMSLNAHLDDLYDANIANMYSTTGEMASAGFVCECLDKSYVPGGEDLLCGTLETLKEMIYSPLLDENGLFPEKTVELEKRNLCDNILASDNDPRIHSYQLCRDLLFEGEAYGQRLVGTVDDVMALDCRELTDFYHEFLVTSAPSFIYIGSRDVKEVKEIAEKYFGDLGGGHSQKGNTIIKKATPPMRMVEEEMAVLQGKLTIGFRSDISPEDKDLYASIIFNDIFGGSPASKLFRNVREKQSLCYYCSSSLDFFKGALFVRSGISNANKDKVINEVLAQFEDIRKGNISDYEFECAKKSLDNYYRQASDSAYALENYYRTRLISEMNTTIEEAAEKLRSVTKEDVIRAARRYEAGVCAFVRGTLSDADDNGEEGEYDE